MYQFPFKSGGFSCSWWPRALERWGLLAWRLRRACARLAREHGAMFRKGATSSVLHMNLARRLRLGAGLPNPGGAPLLDEEVNSY